MKLYLFICACILFCSSCCNKKTCPGDELPVIVVKVSGPLQNDEIIALYKMDSGKPDSSFIHVSNVNPVFSVFPVNDFDDTAVSTRQFIIRHSSKYDTIKQITSVFEDVDIVCDSRWGCGRGLGKNKTKIKKLKEFSYSYRGQRHGLKDTLFLN